MPTLSWVRFARRVPGLVRQRELPHIEALIDLESDRQPSRQYFELSCAVPAVIATFGGLSVFFAWVNGNTGLSLVLGTALTVVLSGAAWLVFFRLYKSNLPSSQQLRKSILKFSPRYASFSNIVGVEHVLTDEFAPLLDEAAGLYHRHCSDDRKQMGEAHAKAVRAIEESLAKLMEAAVSQDHRAQIQALVWAEPLLEELRLLGRTLEAHALASKRTDLNDPLAGIRDARAELEGTASAIEELRVHVTRA